MNQFYMRTSAPLASNKFYNDHSYNPFFTDAYKMPNCTCYAFGRFSEVMGKRANLPTGNAGNWWTSVTAYSRSQSPQVGAVMCWSIPGRAGHVGVVEKVELTSTGKVKRVLCSQSSYGSAHNGMFFGTSWLTPPSYNNWVGGSAVFQGFILNPAVASNQMYPLADSTSTSTAPVYSVNTTTGSSTSNVLGAGDAFLYIAKSKDGDPNAHKWVQEVIPSIGNQAWCAAFVSACAITAKINGKAIGISNGCGGLEDYTVALGGKAIDGPRRGNWSFVPRAGDLVMFYWGSSRYTYDHVGIVTGYSTNPLKLETVEGNTGGGCYSRSYVVNGSSPYSDLKSVVRYVRPNWEAVGGITVDVGSASMMDPYGFVEQVYDKLNTRQDPLIREIGYLNKDMKPSINSSGIKLSIPNYTLLYAGLSIASSTPGGLQAALLSSTQSSIPNYSTTVTYSTNKFSSVQKTIYEFLFNHGCSVAVACGILANIQVLSDYEANKKSDLVGGKHQSVGLFLWHTNKDRMIEKVPNWETNLSGQIQFFWEQVTTWPDYATLQRLIRNTKTENARTAMMCAEQFILRFEQHPNATSFVGKARQAAFDLFNQLDPIITYKT